MLASSSAADLVTFGLRASRWMYRHDFLKSQDEVFFPFKTRHLR